MKTGRPSIQNPAKCSEIKEELTYIHNKYSKTCYHYSKSTILFSEATRPPTKERRISRKVRQISNKAKGETQFYHKAPNFEIG